MLLPLPPEMLDLIVDHLRDEQTTLRTCCVISGSWIPRTRKHLFCHVEFLSSKSHTELWKKASPGSFASPALPFKESESDNVPMLYPSNPPPLSTITSRTSQSSDRCQAEWQRTEPGPGAGII